ncbi:MAG: hypothetical protein OEY34_00265 [Cyclobacteriaceae bacterium]|nr:hypothetical protein [Cyclobacteriaceae bacterium]
MLTELQKDALREIVNIGVGKGAALLGQMVNLSLQLSVPYVDVVKMDEIHQLFSNIIGNNVFSVEMPFRGDYNGVSYIMFNEDSANVLTSALAGIDINSTELNDLKDGALTEVGNIVLNAVMGSFSNILTDHLNFDPPSYKSGHYVKVFSAMFSDSNKKAMVCKTDIKIDYKTILQGEILVVYEIDSYNKLLDKINIFLEDINLI